MIAPYLDELIEDERILEDPLDRLDENRAHVEAGHLRLERLDALLEHLLGFLKKLIVICRVTIYPRPIISVKQRKSDTDFNTTSK